MCVHCAHVYMHANQTECIFKYFACLEIGSPYVAQAGLLPSFLLSFQSAGITGMCFHSRLQLNLFMLLAP